MGVYGAEHPDVALGLNNLAGVYRAMNDPDGAEILYRRSLAIRERVLGGEHPDVGTTLKNLAGLYRDRGLHEKSEPLYRRAIRIAEKALGTTHPETIEIRAAYARHAGSSNPVGWADAD